MSNDDELHSFATNLYTNYQDFLDYSFSLLIEGSTRKLAEALDIDPPLNKEELNLIKYSSILWRAYDESYNGLRPYTNEQIDEFLVLHLGISGFKFVRHTIYYIQFRVRDKLQKQNSLLGRLNTIFHIIRDGYWLIITDFNIYLRFAERNEDLQLIRDVIKDRMDNIKGFELIHFDISKKWMKENLQLIKLAHITLQELDAV